MNDQIDNKLDDVSMRFDELRKKLSEAKIRLVIPEADVAKDVGNLAGKEARALANDELESESLKTDHTIKQDMKWMFANGFKCIFWAAVIAILITGTVWFYHLVMPVSWHFLEPEQVEKISQTLFGGVISTLVTSYAKANLDGKM